MTGWTTIRLGEVCAKIGSGATPRGGSKVYLEDGPYALIRSQNVYNNGFHWNGLAYINEQHASELSNVEVLNSDVLLNITGDSVARVCQVDPGVLPARVNQHVAIVRPKPDKLDPRFLRYLLVSRETQAKLLSWAGSGGTRKALTKGMIESLEVFVPNDIGKQRAIAHVLGTLDDKIALNRRMSETLEAMARALFTSWFVDFDPVRTKLALSEAEGMEGRNTGLPSDISALFPDRLVDSELGEIPEGWEVSTIGDVAEHPRRTIQPDEINPSAPYIGLQHMPKRSITLSEWEPADGIGSNKYEFERGEILFGKLRPYFHKVGVAPVDGVCSTDIVVIAPKTEQLFAFVLAHLSSDEFVAYTNAGSTGTKMPRTNWKYMARYNIVVPPAQLLEMFSEQIGPAVDRIISSIYESHTLAALRDTLLPKLISGEVRVAEPMKAMANE